MRLSTTAARVLLSRPMTHVDRAPGMSVATSLRQQRLLPCTTFLTSAYPCCQVLGMDGPHLLSVVTQRCCL